MEFDPPAELTANCRSVPGGDEWLATVPELIDRAITRWGLRIEDRDRLAQGTASLVLAVRCADDSPAVLKLGLPHMEAADEIAGLRFWNGNPTVRLLDADEANGVMLLERCVPGTPLSSLPEEEQDEVVVSLLRELWSSADTRDEPDAETETAEMPRLHGSFRPLSEMLAYWSDEVRERSAKHVDSALIGDALSLFEELPRTSPRSVLLATDLHAGNVLRAERRGWLVIDPKPFVGDPAYDVTQHLLNCGTRMAADPLGVVSRVADLAELDTDRVRLWMFARAATTSSANPSLWRGVARALAP